ncbi:CPBP family intramembrane metalloprotease [Flammeovirga yaeyamensis]|uniref:CPBP family intramembrane metalloprotease n=1 Tax=Flammeovirga yaeyamensis TaxID=367791 RepID=A0AAX1NFC4_9BACT|nr:type II CAAX endopeptidase family protein [Flammeovirga yaeyamensis]MBB3696856.1 membrane protease YdiL (CAAX protease family) [Flammeovirga yaeyamensis]NMF33522.1 CPBP family intramembrane metalloprotease [Flammeovirga yaeyamensis]QWG05208.1 CPBP family intramembrane metalloprotease [Flammeovirga yaeyamensis]
MQSSLKYASIFIAITLILTWSFTAIIFQDESTIGMFALCMFIPAVVGIILNAVRYKSIKKVIEPLAGRLNAKSTLFAFLYPILFIGLLAVIHITFGFGTLNQDKLENLYTLPTLGGMGMGLLLIFGEEYGWRGFLLPNLAESLGKVKAMIIVGIVWALWHAPIVYMLAKVTNFEHPLGVMILQMGAVFVFSFPFAYAWFESKNVLPPMIFHYVWNFYNPIILGNIYMHNPGIVDGNVMLINGEGLAGLLLGLLFVGWYVYKLGVRS